MQMNRVMIFLYNVLIIFAFAFQLIAIGPAVFGSQALFWGLASVFALSVTYFTYKNFLHPTPLEIVSYHINLIMRHLPDEEDDGYEEKNQLYVSDRFLESERFRFFYYEDCCAKLDKFAHMKIKLAIGPEEFNDVVMIIQTMDEQYIKFRIIKETTNPLTSFLYGWSIDEIEYSTQTDFLELVDG